MFSLCPQEPPMSVGLYFRPAGFTPGLYDNVIKQLNQAGAGFGSVPGLYVPLRYGGGRVYPRLRCVGINGTVPEVRGNIASHHEEAGRGSRPTSGHDGPHRAKRLGAEGIISLWMERLCPVRSLSQTRFSPSRYSATSTIERHCCRRWYIHVGPQESLQQPSLCCRD